MFFFGGEILLKNGAGGSKHSDPQGQEPERLGTITEACRLAEQENYQLREQLAAMQVEFLEGKKR